MEHGQHKNTSSSHQFLPFFSSCPQCSLFIWLPGHHNETPTYTTIAYLEVRCFLSSALDSRLSPLAARCRCRRSSSANMTKPSAATKKTNTTVKLVHNGSMPTPEGPVPLAEFKKASQLSGSTERVAAASKSNKQPSQPQSWYVGPADFKPEDFPALSES